MELHALTLVDVLMRSCIRWMQGGRRGGRDPFPTATIHVVSLLTSGILHGYFAQFASHVANDDQDLDEWGVGCRGDRGVVLLPAIQEEL